MQNLILPAQRFTIEDVATFNGKQETPDIAPFFGEPIELWTLTETLSPSLIKNGTFTRATIEAALGSK
jgi:hypothetical protein